MTEVNQKTSPDELYHRAVEQYQFGNYDVATALAALATARTTIESNAR